VLFVIEWSGPGRLATMARPRGGVELPEAMTSLAEAGVQVLVSALCAEEAERLELAGEAAAATGAGLEFINFPIVDGLVPEPGSLAAGRLADRLAEDLRAERYVVTHCLAGIGRSSLLAGAALIRLGTTPDQAWRLIRAARGLHVPENLHQERWLYEFAEGAPA
jgi:protein-tyrosine phosphatase